MARANHASVDSAAHHETLTPSARWILASLSLSMLMPSLDTSVANVSLPTLARAFDASFQNVQWIVLAYLVAITSLIVGAGRIGDVFGRRRVLLAGVVVFTGASLACGVATSIGFLLAARALQGVGAAMMMALAIALVGETVPKPRIGSAMGLLGTMSAIGTTLGPSLGGVLLVSTSWRMIFLVNVPIGVVNFLLVRRHVAVDRENRGATASRFDVAGTLLLAATLAMYAIAVTRGRGTLGATNVAVLVAAALTLALFLFVEARVESPMLRLALFRQSSFSASLFTNAIVSTVMMATLVVGPFYLSRGLGLNAAVVGVVMSVGPLVSALSGIPAGRAVDRLGANAMILAALSGMAVGLVALVLAPSELRVVGYLGPIVIVTASYALFQAANNTLVMSEVSSEDRGVVSGTLSLSRNLGLITGAAVMGAVFSHAAGIADVASAHAPAFARGMRATYGVAAMLIASALVVAFVSRRSPKLRAKGVRVHAGANAAAQTSRMH